MTKIISPSNHSSNRNLIGRPTVSVGGSFPAGTKIETQSQIYDTLDMLVSSKPNWRFVGSADTNAGNNVRVCSSFKIFEDDEFLGDVSISYKGRYYKIKVDNERISAARERGSGYHTDDPVKAQLRIRKTFFRRNNEERMDKAFEMASTLISKEHGAKSWEYRAAKDSLLSKATDYARANLTAYLAAYPNLQHKFEKYNDTKAVYRCVDQVKTAFDNSKSIVVASDGTQYIVKSEEGNKIFSDETLPYEMRRKLGLLKLVQDGQMISGVGCRVNSTIFVLLPEEAKEQE